MAAPVAPPGFEHRWFSLEEFVAFATAHATMPISGGVERAVTLYMKCAGVALTLEGRYRDHPEKHGTTQVLIMVPK